MKLRERKIAKKISKKNNYVMEVPCEYGRMDLVSDDEIIEIKHYKLWKHGIGQLLVYGIENQEKSLVLLLYSAKKDRIKLEEKKRIECAMCNFGNIELKWHEACVFIKK